MSEQSQPTLPLPEIIQRYVNGESVQTIAVDARVTRRTIYKWMHREAGPEYEGIVTEAMIARMADADHALSIAETTERIARAREEARYTRWDLERRRPALFGPKQEVKNDTTITVIVQRSTPIPVLQQIEQAETEAPANNYTELRNKQSK